MRFMIPLLALIAVPAFATESPPPANLATALPTDLVLCRRATLTWAANYINGSEAKGVLENGIQLIQCSNAPAAIEPKMSEMKMPPMPAAPPK